MDGVARIDIPYTATKFQRNRSDCCVKVLCNYPIVMAARAISKEEWDMLQIPVQERERLNDTLDPKVDMAEQKLVQLF